MALIESLKAFYKDNVENVDKLNNADSLLEVLRAKYGNYKGSNIEEYFKELVNNGISPGSGGGATFPTFTVSGGQYSCDMTYEEAKAVWIDNGDVMHRVPCFAGNEWATYSLFDGEAFQQAKSDFNNVPDDMTEGCIIMRSIPFLFGSDGNFYLRNAN